MHVVCAHRVCVSTVGAAVGAERQGHGGVEDAKLADHLLHAAYGPLFISVSELYHQTRRSSLRETHGQLYSYTYSRMKIIIFHTFVAFVIL